MSTVTVLTSEAARAQGRTDRIVPTLDGVRDLVVAQSFGLCLEVVRTRARNFYYGLRLTPEPRRSAVYAIYAWMRAGDDAADAHSDPAKQRAALAEFRAATEAVLSGRFDPHTPSIWLAFAAAVQSYNVPREHIESMIAGLEEDLEHRQYETDEELRRYCYRVASTVGLVCVRIWGLREGCETTDVARAADMAERRGQAFQLTNILRDFRQDFDGAPRRVYLSRESFARQGLTPEDLRSWHDDSVCHRFVMAHADVAQEHFAASDGLEDLIDPACRPTLWAMTKIYHGLLELIVADPKRVVGDKRIRLSSARKGLIALRAMLGAR